MTTSDSTPPVIEGDIMDVYLHCFPQSFVALCESASREMLATPPLLASFLTDT